MGYKEMITGDYMTGREAERKESEAPEVDMEKIPDLF
jgi:hypothetical protein